ncbi:unnamed protein product, partial [Amoebophrya sp. A25]
RYSGEDVASSNLSEAPPRDLDEYASAAYVGRSVAFTATHKEVGLGSTKQADGEVIGGGSTASGFISRAIAGDAFATGNKPSSFLPAPVASNSQRGTSSPPAPQQNQMKAHGISGTSSQVLSEVPTSKSRSICPDAPSLSPPTIKEASPRKHRTWLERRQRRTFFSITIRRLFRNTRGLFRAQCVAAHFRRDPAAELRFFCNGRKLIVKG